jgi:hypothetical protein
VIHKTCIEHSQGDPGEAKSTIQGMKCLASFLRNPTEFFKDDRNQKILILSSLFFLFLCLLALLVRTAARRGEAAANISDAVAISAPVTPTVMPTKWWIKMTVTSSPTPWGLTAPTLPLVPSASNCQAQFSSPLKAGIYAYISLAPPLPNRLRSDASLSTTYLGQIEPGEGLKVIDGPVCADGYSWWLVESLQDGLRGWTVEGKSSEQWILPCPNESVICSQTADSVSSGVASKNDKNKDKNETVCKSNKLAVGMLAQVGQDSLLVVRAEPYIGEVNGRASPMSIVKVIDGPTCVRDTIWWKLNIFDLDLVGWARENDLYACPKDSECNLGPS